MPLDPLSLTHPITLGRPLADLVAGLEGMKIRGEASVRIEKLSYRSAEAGPGTLFFCVPGTRLDGHDFAARAAEDGASAILVERWLPIEATQVRVPSVRAAMGPIAAEFHGRPSERLTIVGVTGTNGKTTTTYLLESIYRAARLPVGVIGTTGVHIAGEPVPVPRTTPEAPDLQALLARMVDRKVRGVAMEVSSHGLHQHRVGGIRFACAVFTNLSQDHLDYHGTLEDYLAAKAVLFTPEMTARSVVNLDAPESRTLLRKDVPAVTYGIHEPADVRAEDVRTGADGLSFTVDGLEVTSRLRGSFNVYNCLAALASARSVGIEDRAIVRGIAELRGVPGRLEPVEAGQDFLVLVDYAHTPDSLENVLSSVRALTTGRVIVAFGCGGDRDRDKRPMMGEVAGRLADLTIITSDNPRSEDPLAITGEIERGATKTEGRFVVESDRREAIRQAVTEARSGDVVVIAGKGHETGQEFADHTVPFDDRIVAAEEIGAMLR